MSDARLRELALSSWTSLNAHLKEFTLADVKRAIELELKSGRRPTYVKRLAMRQHRLERAEENLALDKLLRKTA
jgi:hypothetical protein